MEPTWEPPREGAPAEAIEEEVDDNDIQEEFQEDSDIGACCAAECVIIGEGHISKPGVSYLVLSSTRQQHSVIEKVL